MGARNVTQKSEEAESENVTVTSPRDDPAPPVFGSPIDKTYLASIANKVGVGVNLISEIAQNDDRDVSSSPQTITEGSSSDEQLLERPSLSEATGGQELPIAQPAADVTLSTTMLPTSDTSVSATIEKKKQEKLIPIVFHWDHRGNENEVYVCGSFNNWEKIPMNMSRDNFTAIVDLPEGRHQYKFFVDGEWLHDPGEECQDNGLGTLNNVVSVTQKDFDMLHKAIDLSSFQKGNVSPPGSYSQEIPPRSATSGLPPHLPPLLQQTILNQSLPSEENPTLLPDPNHVTLNHLFALSIKDGVLVMGTTNRYKEKYITTLMYKPVQ